MFIGMGSSESTPAHTLTIVHTIVTETAPIVTEVARMQPHKTHVCIHASPETGMHAAVFIFASPNTHICTHEHEKMWLCKHTD